MYYEHFGLSDPPFRITPDTRLFFPGGSRGAILDAIVYAVESGEGIIKVVGEVGSGKTMLCRMLEVKLSPSVEVVYLANPSLSPDNILHAIAFEMKLPVSTGSGRLEVMHALHQRLLEKHADNRQVVMFVEEAQRMPLETLEEIRLLSNLETEREKLLQIVLFGQPELERNLSPTHIRQLKERITHSFYLPRLAADEIREYLDFRMRSAGYKGPPVFSPAAVKLIARSSQGLIRRINILADKALLSAYARGVHEITPREARTAARDSEFGRPRLTWDWRVASVFGAGVLGAALMWLAQVGYRHVPGLAGAAEPVARVAAAGGPALMAEPPAPPADTSSPAQPVTDLTAVPAGAGVSGVAAAGPAAVSGSGEAPTPAPASAAAPGGAAPQTVAARPTAPAPVEPAAEARPGGAQLAAALVSERSLEPARAGAPDAAAPRPVPAMPAVAAPAEPRPDPSADGDASTARPAAGKDTPYLVRRLAATEEWLKTADASRYSIQLMHIGIDRGAGLEASLRQTGLGADLDRVWVYRTRIRGTGLLSVLLGEYSSQEEARRVLEGLPPALRQPRPFVRSVRDIRAGGPAGDG